MKLLDLFSGIGGFHLGFENAGFHFDKVYFSEIDKYAIANYKYNFPNATHIGSVTDILSSGIERPNIITFGSPCQDFSLAGKREGLAGNKSSLIEYALSAISRFRPDVFIWENVKGTFSSNNSQDFWSIIQAFANIGGYELEWQLVNTSWLLPQNRERIYLVGHLATSFRNWQPIFPITKDDFNSYEKEHPNRETYKCRNIAGCLTGGGHSGGLHSDMDVVIVSRGHGFAKESITDLCPSIRSSSFEHNTSVIQVNHSKESGGKQPYQHNRIYSYKGLMIALDTDSGRKSVLIKDNIRRLTEIECERLQGFPDNWTQFGCYDGIVKPIAKTQRYKMCGNAVTAKIVELIGKRIHSNL